LGDGKDSIGSEFPVRGGVRPRNPPLAIYVFPGYLMRIVLGKVVTR